MQNLDTQKQAFEVLFKEPEATVYPTTAYLIPVWQSVDSTYSGAVLKVLDAIKKSRPFLNYREGEIDEAHLKETNRKKELIAKLPKQDGKYIVLNVQLGQKYQGVSVQEVRKQFDASEFGLGAYEMACILLAHPEVLSNPSQLWIDCPGDDWKWTGESGFSSAPIFVFDGGGLEFDAGRLGGAYENCGSSSGFAPR